MFKKIIKRFVYLIMLLFYTITADSTSAGNKTIIVGAILYFFLPTDLIPDLLPVIGVADDFGAVVAAVSAIMSSSTPDIKQRAKEKVDSYLQ